MATGVVEGRLEVKAQARGGHTADKRARRCFVHLVVVVAVVIVVECMHSGCK